MFYSVLISVLICSLAVYYFLVHKKYDLIFLLKISFGSILFVFLTILITKIVLDKTVNQESEYRGYLITSARYYEYWETWVEQTCSRQVPCGESCSTDANGNTSCTTVYCTEYYDCSYCDKNPPYWIVIDNYNNTNKITKERYDYLVKKWKREPIFSDMNRKINNHFNCGKDGDMYVIFWDKDIITSEPKNINVSYINKAKSKNSTFYYGELSVEEKQNNILYDYPDYYDKFYNKQRCVLGIENLKISKKNKDTINIYYEYLNGIGFNTHCKVFLMLFPNKPLSNALIQEKYWQNGHRNEIVVCIGYDSITNKLDWVKSFSWTDNKRIHVDIREDLMNIDTLDLKKMYPIIKSNIQKTFTPKSIEDFDYIENYYPVWSYVFSILISIFVPLIIFLNIKQLRYKL